MSTRLPEDLIDLLVSEATEGLDEESLAALDQKLNGRSNEERRSFEHAAAVAHLALLDGSPAARSAMPDEARSRLLGAVRAAGNDPRRMTPPAVEPQGSPERSNPGTATVTPIRTGVGGWLVAAGIAIAWGTSFVFQQGLFGLGESGAASPTPVPIAQTPTAAEQRRALLAEAPDTITVAWGQSTEAFAGVTGDVVWSNARQEGYMRLAGMPANDPAALQYQLWIVDPERDKEPVDGGVFDVADAVGGEVIIPIEAKLGVVAPAAFAITEEQPGGVVVSEGPLVLVAAI